MRKRFFLPLFVLLVFFPLIIFLLSFTRFFNDTLRDILVSAVDDGTNATLHLGNIHGSVFGTLTIDGAALTYRDRPLVLVDTIRITHLPLSLLTKTIQATRVRLVNPRFFLVRFSDGSYNVDHIGKPGSGKGGRFDWTIMARSIGIRGGSFTLYDSTENHMPGRQTFDAGDFTVSELNLDASAELSGDNLSANVSNLAMRVDPPGTVIDSMKFAFFTTPGGTEISGFRLKSGKALISIDLALTGQDLLDSLNASTIRNKYFTAGVDIKDLNTAQVDGFVKLPVSVPTRFDLNTFVSGTLDAFSVKQFLLRTDSSIVPFVATFRNVLDASRTMDVKTEGASLNMAELSSILGPIGFPEAGRMGKVNLTASAVGRPADFKMDVNLFNDRTSVSGTSRLNGGSYDGSIAFRGVNMGEILNDPGFMTGLSGSATFSVVTSGGGYPSGTATLTLDSSSFDHIFVPAASVRLFSVADSVAANLSLLTSRGNLDGHASMNLPDNSYSADVTFSELDPAPFVHVPSLEGNMTGRLVVNGRGFKIDSLRTQLSLLMDRATLGDLQLGNSAFTLELNTERADKRLQLNSPFVDASVNGNFVPHELPGQMAELATAIADSFRMRLAESADSNGLSVLRVPALHADVDVEIKDARLLGQLIGHTQMSGTASAHIQLNSEPDSVAISGFVTADTLDLVRDSLRLGGSQVYAGFDFKSDSGFSVWNSGSWSAEAQVGSFSIGNTVLSSKHFRLNYICGDSVSPPRISIAAVGRVDTLVEFGLNAAGNVQGNNIELVADSIGGAVYGVPLSGRVPLRFTYTPETFNISPAVFNAEVTAGDSSFRPTVAVSGLYSLRSGADLHFLFHNFGLKAIQKLARLDTNSLKLNGFVSGTAALGSVNDTTLLSVDFTGNDVSYNGSIARRIHGKIGLSGDVMSIDAQLSKENDSSRYSLKLEGTIPLTAGTQQIFHVDLAADSQDVSFLTPFMSGVQDFGGNLSGSMIITGSYSSPEMKGQLVLNDGRIRLAANEVDYLYNATVIGQGNQLLLSPLVIRNVPGQTGGTILANGSITVGRNTIERFDLNFDGALLVINSTARRTVEGIYGSAIVGAGNMGLRLRGSLERPMLSGTLNIQSADLTLLPIQKQQSTSAQEIIYHFPVVHEEKKSDDRTYAGISNTPAARSGSVIDSLRYDLEVETRDNVNLRMIFDPTTNEELSSVLGGRLHLSNLSGAMELTGVVSVQNNSYYNFYGRHFAATGKLSFTGDPLNPTLDITAQYTGEHADTNSANSTGRIQNVVVQLGISGTFEQPNPPNISMTVDGSPYQQGDVQTNAISFILTNQFADELTSPVKRSVADNLWNQAGAGILTAGTSILSGALTNLFSREFTFIRSAELRYSSIQNLGNPDVAITTQFGKATIRLGGQPFSDISNTDVSADYPLADLLGNMLYLQLSHKTALNNRTFQRETVNALRLFYQLSF